jgi:hypothetical protein
VPTPLLDSNDYGAIRGELGSAEDEERVPGELIVSAGFLPDALAEVLRRVPGAETLEGEARRRVRLAAVKLTAARLAPKLPNVTRESSGAGESYETEAVDVRALVAQLRAEAEVELSAALGEEEGSLMPTFFAAAPGGRGR